MKRREAVPSNPVTAELKAEKIEAVLFDAGNTIVYPDYDLIVNTLEQFGVRMNAHDLYRLDCLLKDEYNLAAASGVEITTLWEDYSCELLKRAGVDSGVMDQVLSQLAAYNEAEELWTKVFDEARAVLDELQAARFTLGVVSNSDGRIERYLYKTGLRGYFDFVVDSYLVGIEKPDPQIFRIGLELAHAAPEEIVFVGDSYLTDIVGARSVGMHAVMLREALLFSQTSLQVSENSFDCPVIMSLADLIPLIIKSPVI